MGNIYRETVLRSRKAKMTFPSWRSKQSVYKSVRSVDCHCSFLKQDDIVSVPPPPVHSAKLLKTSEAEGYPPTLKVLPSSDESCATLFRDWHYQGYSFPLEFSGSAGKIELGLTPRVRSISVRNGCTVNLWSFPSGTTDRQFNSSLSMDATEEYFDFGCCFCDKCSETVCQKAQRSLMEKSLRGSRSLIPSSNDFSQFVKYGKKIVGIGRNYRWQTSELAQLLSIPTEPIVFLKPSTSYITEGQLIKLPESLGTIFYELELGVVIGKQGTDISEDKALDHVAGYFLALDMTAKQFIRRSDNQSLPWEIGKGFDSACPVGDFIPKSQIPDPNNVHLECKVNGQVTQSDNTSKMIFNVQQLIAYVSKYMTLEPYDVILTGTPDGFGPLRAGDMIEGRMGNITSIQFMAASR